MFIENNEVFTILVCVLISFLIGLLLLLLPNILIPKFTNVNLDKLSAFECGFDPFQDTRSTFDVRFYLVAILFIIFDIDIFFFFLLFFFFVGLDYQAFLVMFFFLIILFIGFLYEWIIGALDW